MAARQPTKFYLGGRGAGKSVAIEGKTSMRIKPLARGRGLFASTTYKQILDSTLPAIESKLKEKGFIEDVHYVVGKKPPMHFERPYATVRNFENCLSFWNGYNVTFMSGDRMDLRRGGSFDCADIDECALLKKEFITRVIFPSIRGNKNRFSHWLHQQVCFYTSMPWKPAGYWIFEYEELAQTYPELYLFLMATIYDNIDVLGEKGVERLKQTMTHLEFQVECMNMRIRKVEGGFYYKFDEEIHTYTPEYQYDDHGERGITYMGNADYKPNELIDASFDFGGWFSGCVLFQAKESRTGVIEQAIDSFHVKDDEKINELVDKVCIAYQDHKFKYIRLWGEPRGTDKNELSVKNIYQKIKERFEKHGWQAEIKVTPHQSKAHSIRFKFMNDILAEEDPNLPKFRFNADTCKDVIIAVMTTETNNKFEKIKAKEKDRNFPQEHATHFPDMIDYYAIQKHAWRLQIGSLSGGGEFAIS